MAGEETNLPEGAFNVRERITDAYLKSGERMGKPYREFQLLFLAQKYGTQSEYVPDPLQGTNFSLRLELYSQEPPGSPQRVINKPIRVALLYQRREYPARRRTEADYRASLRQPRKGDYLDLTESLINLSHGSTDPKFPPFYGLKELLVPVREGLAWAISDVTQERVRSFITLEFPGRLVEPPQLVRDILTRGYNLSSISKRGVGSTRFNLIRLYDPEPFPGKR